MTAAPELAIVLAAGNGTRLESRGARPKPLVEVGGLPLLLRSLLGLEAVGIRRFRIVTGAHREEVEAAVASWPQIAELDVELAYCPDFARGNGASLGRGLEGVSSDVLVAMADHVFDRDFLASFLGAVAATPERPILATDTDPASVFDLDDATKVATEDGCIVAIGKELERYDRVDAGLFYFPAEIGPTLIDAGASTISQVVSELATRLPFRAAPVEGMWQDVDDRAMAREAEDRLLRSLSKPTDGPVSRWLNRPLSTALSRHLARWHVSPNAITTFVTALTLVGAGFAAAGTWTSLLLAGVIFQLASVLDGCDGEVARLRHAGTRLGAWYDTLSDNARYLAFYAAIGYAAYLHTKLSIYLWGIAALLALGIVVCGAMARYVWRTQHHLTNLAVLARFRASSSAGGDRLARLIRPVSVLGKQDVQAFFVALFCIAGAPHLLFPLLLLGTLLMTVGVLRSLPTAGRPIRLESMLRLGGLALGASLFAFLVARLPFAAVADALDDVGAGLFWVLVVAPTWFAANALATGKLLGRPIGFRHLLHNQVVGEAFNALLPLAGLGGEPFKIRHLSRWTRAADATRVSVHDRILQALSGALFTAGCLVMLAFWVPLSEAVLVAVITVAVALAVLAGLLWWGLTSRLPGRFVGAVAAKLLPDDVVEGDRAYSVATLAGALGYKLVARAASLVEVWTIFVVLGTDAGAVEIVAVTGLLAASSVIFFVVPQGIGVNEAGITGAFALLGLPPALGLAFALIRRARIVTWAVAGLGIAAADAVLRRGAADEPSRARSPASTIAPLTTAAKTAALSRDCRQQRQP